jgi:hypothetical protein
MKTTFLKSLIAAIIAVIAAYVASAETINYVYIAVYVIGYTAWYAGKNYLFPSVSVLGTIDLRDILSGIILAIGSGVMSFAATLISGITFTWPGILNAVWISVLAYITTKFGTGTKIA